MQKVKWLCIYIQVLVSYNILYDSYNNVRNDILTGVVWFFFTALLVTPGVVVREVVRLEVTVEGRETVPVVDRADDVGFLSIILGLLGIDPPALFGSLFNDVKEDAGLGPAELTDDLGLGLGDIKGVDGLEGDWLNGPLKIKYPSSQIVTSIYCNQHSINKIKCKTKYEGT